MSGFVDIHSHILYGLDDGARTPADSAAMLDLAGRNGTTDIVATPHANARYRFQPDVIAAQIAELMRASSVRIHPGCDFHLRPDNIADALAHPDKYTVNHRRYLLVEFPDVGVISDVDTTFKRMIDAGISPIITHPERNLYLRQNVDELARWVARGCFVQVTAGSYLGTFGRRANAAAMELLTRGLTHFVASDAHDLSYRPPTLTAAYALLADRWGEEWVRPLFVENPGAVIEGGAIDYEFRPGARPKKWYQFWRRS